MKFNDIMNLRDHFYVSDNDQVVGPFININFNGKDHSVPKYFQSRLTLFCDIYEEN